MATRPSPDLTGLFREQKNILNLLLARMEARESKVNKTRSKLHITGFPANETEHVYARRPLYCPMSAKPFAPPKICRLRQLSTASCTPEDRAMSF